MQHKFTPTTHLKRAALTLLALVFACATPSAAFAQNLAEYAFTTGVDQNQWITLSNSATQIVASGQDDAYSSLTNIGFSFPFGDGTYTQFWANANGIFSFNSTPTTNYSNQFNSSNCTKNQPKICGISRDMSTGTDGYVKYELTGTSPNRVLVCEFYLFGNGSNIDSATIKWQVQLHESTSKVVIVYGASSSDPYYFQIGLSQSGSDIWTVDPSTHEATHLTEGVETEYEVWPGENRYYEFAPLPFTISDDGNTYTINSAEGWGMFCDTLTLKPSGYFTGKTVKLGANISITQSAGSDDHRFMGTFDGQEHTLDVNITDTGEQGTAPFRFISNATIRNLHVTGTVTGTTHAAGLVGKASAGTILIENCLVEANVNSTVGNNRHCGGIVGHGFGGNNPVDLTLRNCVYAGTITCDKNYIGGLQGWSDGNTLTLENCLFAGNYQGTATGTAAFHPIALHNTSSATNLTATNVFAAVAPTATNANFIAADGTKTTGRATAPAGLGTQGATYSFMDMTVYENGLYYNGLYYVAPTLSTDNNGAYLINNENDWDYFCDALYNNGTWNRFSGQTVKLGADISVTRMAGYDNHDFLGTFDGNHKTLTFTATATASYLAPFRNVLGNSDTDHAVIHDLNVVTNITAHDQRHMAGLIALVWGYVDVTNCNVTVDITATKGSTNTDLYSAGIASQVVKDAQIAVSGCTVDGTISTDGKYAGGIIGIAQGSATITDCLSSVTIDSSTDGDGTHGGLVAVQGNYDGKTLTIEGCVFNGQLLGASTHSCGGFVGWRSQTVNITNSLFVPVQVTINTVDGNTPCATFVRNWTMPDNANCYYTDALGTPQGTQAYSINSGENVIGVYNISGYTYTYNTSRLYFYNTGFCHNQGLSTYKQYAAAGDEVHISISTTISCADFITEPAGIPLTLSSNGAYRFFTMPSSNVTINAEWSSSAVVSDFPWTENFNDLTDEGRIPDCWNYMEIEGTFFDRWGYFTTAINGYGATNGTSYDGTNCVRYNSYNNFNGTTNYLKTVPLSLPASPEMQLSFWYKNPAGGDFSVYLSTDGGDTHTTALATGLTNQQEWTPYTISLGAYAGQEVVIVFKGTSNRNYNGDAYIYLDEVNVEDVLPCAKPTHLMATILGTQRVQLGWTNGDEDQTDWQICLDGDESNLIAVDSNPFILDNLEILSTHTAKVRANCGGDGVSYWSNEVSFTMPLHDPVSYIDMNGDTQRCIDFTVLDGSETFPLAAGWYVVEGALNYNQTLTVSGDVHLILKDNAVMNIGTAETPVSGNGFGDAGPNNFSIHIYGQSTGENNGQLNVYASQNGIWAYDGDFNCSSARVSVTASSYGIWALAYNYSSKGNIKLKDATVTVNSTNDHAIYAQGGNINIDGGKVSATGKNYVIYAYKQYYDGGNLTISGSQVTANGGNYGIFASGGSLNISGGQVTASGSTYGILASSGGLNISGGQVTANGGYGIYAYGCTITLGWTNPTDFIHADSYYIDYSNSNITLSQAFIDEDGNLYSGTVARVNGTYAINGKTLYPYIEGSVPYIDENGERQLCLQGNYTLLEGTETSLGTAGQETWYVADGTRNYSQTLTLYGDVHLILKDGAVMNVGTEQQPISGEYGIGENGSLHIYGQSAGSGHLYIYCEEYGISVDDDYEQNGGNVTISAGIHGIFTGGDVTLRDGTLSTIGDSYYGISGGGNVNILGGKCTAKSKQRLTGINANSDGSIILGWKNADDYIDASGYSLSNSNAVVQVADGQAFIDEEGNTYSGIIERDGTTYTYPVDGKKLLPYIEGSVPYLDENGQRQLCTEYTVLDGTETTLAAGWYVADGTLNYNQTLIPSGDVHLILKDNAAMNIGTAETPVSGNGFGDAGPNNFSINIYGQSTGENNGQLNIYASQYGIWAYNGDFNCSSARVSVTASSYGIWALAYNSSKGSINLKDATVTVNVPGSNAIYAQGGNINIDGGQVSATGNDHVIYAYMQYNGGSITINNSDVTATATSDYCIFASGGSITINNSDVTATATSDYCIFTGNGDIYINGSTVSATGNANVIYADRYSTGGYITIYNSDVTATATSNYCIYAYGGNINIIGSTVSATGNDYVIFSSRYSNGGTIYISGGQVTATATSHNSIFAGGGDLRIISGQVTANGGDYGLYASAGSLYISGGQVTANGGDYGLYASAGSLYISGGQVTANGGNYGIYAYGGTITLGWTNPTDFIHANSYYINYSSTNITLSNDFIDEDNAVYSGTITQVDGAYAIDGKTLYPYIEGSVPYIDENGQRQLCTEYNVLNGTETTLAAGWYVADSTLNYSQTLILSGDVHLILKDGAVMNVGSTENPVGDGYGITGEENYSISIYAQSMGDSKGQLHVNAEYHGIYAKEVNICGGEVMTVSVNTNGIYARNGNITIYNGHVTSQGGRFHGILAIGDIIINGGQVTSTGRTYGIWSDGGNLTINGGQVTANGGTYGIYTRNGNLTLGWTNASDFIYANNYYVNNGTLSIAEGKTFIDEDGTPHTSGTVNASDINGKTLYPDCVVFKQVEGYEDGEGGYCLIASPNVDNTDPATINGMTLAGDDAANYDLYRFDPSNEGSEWVNYKTDSFNLVNGHGYLYATKNTKTLVFTGPFITDAESVAVDLEYDAADDHKCWNLVGNPFPCEATINKPYYKLSDDGTTINPTAIEGNIPIPPCTAVFVKGESGDDRVVFSKVSAPASSAPIGAINGLFSVSADKQVYFSQGNLQYQPSTATWRFAPNQYDLLFTPEDLNLYHSAVGNYADVTSLYTENYTDWIDFFGWGTSGWNSGAIAYMPYDPSYTADDFYPGGDYNNDLTGTCANADWAWYNPISNGGNAANQWRTLTHDEWAYLFNTREGAASKYGHGSVDGVNGMIILPDNWTLPDGCSFTPGNSDWTNSYTTTEWAAMEAAGAVFLPAAGQRSFGTFVNNVGNLGRYWSSTHRNSTAAYDVWFHSDFISELDTQAYYSNRSMGYSVRPVQDAQ